MTVNNSQIYEQLYKNNILLTCISSKDIYIYTVYEIPFKCDKNCLFKVLTQGFFWFSTIGCFTRVVSVAGLLLLEGSQFGGSEAGGVSPRNERLFQGENLCLFGNPRKTNVTGWKITIFHTRYRYILDFVGWFSIVFFLGGLPCDWMLFWFGSPKDGGRVFSWHFLKLKRKSLLKGLPATSHCAKFTSFISPSKSCQSKKSSQSDSVSTVQV